MVRIGLVDFDTSHVTAFTERLNHVGVDARDWVEGARVVAGCPGDSRIMPERIPGYTEGLRGYGVEIVDRPEDLLGKIDAVMIESQQGSRHLERARPFLEAGLPTFIDKPFAGSLEEADEIIALAERHNAPMMSCSALRYAPEVREALKKRREFGEIVSVDVWGPCALHPGNPGLLHYGIHGVEILFTLMGKGCVEVRDHSGEPGQVTVGRWESGSYGVVRGLRAEAYGFGFAAHYERGHFTTMVQGSAYYGEMLKAIVGMFKTGKPAIDPAETRAIMAFIDAAGK